MERELNLIIIAEDLDKINFGGYGSRIRLGIQRGKDVVDVVSVEAGTGTFVATLRAQPMGDGANFLGPYAHGTKEARFVYLVWLSESGSFGRVKLHLSGLKWEQTASPLTMRVSLLGKAGKPVFASVKPDQVSWSSSDAES